MTKVHLINELIGGPFDGRTWNAYGPPHWEGRLVWGANRPEDKTLIVADYRFQSADFHWVDGEPCYRFRYQFVAVRPKSKPWLRSLWPQLRRRLA